MPTHRRLSNLTTSLLVLFALFPALPPTARASSKDLGNGFLDHGVCAPISQHRGTVATTDGSHDVVLSWLMDHRGTYELLMVDVNSGKASEFKFPFDTSRDSPFASILSSENKFYTHFGSHFVEFDPVAHAFTFIQKIEQAAPSTAMAMTEDDNGVIWSASYPNCSVVSFNPRTRKLRDYGSVYKQNWAIYPRGLAADDAGWIYIGIGNVLSQMLALNPATGDARAILDESHRPEAMASLYRDLDGKVYGRAKEGDPWWQLYRGKAREIGNDHTQHPKAYIAGYQSLFHDQFPDGKKLKTFDLEQRHLVVESPDKQTKALDFDYTSEGAIVMDAIASPTGTITGGTTFPMRCFTYDPRTDTLTNRADFPQWNAVGRSTLPQDHHIFIGGYPRGHLLDWNLDAPWVDTDWKKGVGNPLSVANCERDINRPACVLPLNDGKTVIMGGTPDYGRTGGGLLFWDRPSRQQLVLTDEQVVPNQSTISLAALDDGLILGGTTADPGSGGEKKAKQAELYILDLKDHRVHWHQPVIPGIQSFNGLQRAGNLVVGVAENRLFFVFDPIKRQLILQRDLKEFGNTATGQGPRPFVTASTGEIYLLTTRGIVAVEKQTWNLNLLAKSPVPIEQGGAFLENRIYFISGSHLDSWQAPNPDKRDPSVK